MRILFLLLFFVTVHAHADLPVRQTMTLPEGIFKTVLVTGYGETPALARADAFRLAVEQAAGIIVASETQTSRQQITRDQIATYSQARVSNFAIVVMAKTNDIWLCQTWVTVRSACTTSTYNCVN